MEDQITKEVIKQYEQIRKMGLCNMFDFRCVSNIADQIEFYDLAELTREEYVYILSNFRKLMKKYNITRK